MNQAEGLASPKHASADEVVVIVDPFGFQAGELLPEFAQQRGLQPLIVFSSPDLPAYFTKSFPRDRYVVIDHKTPEETATAIRKAAGKRKIRAVLPGTESGVILAAGLNYEFQLPGIPHELAHHLREKAAMHETLYLAGLPYARSGRAQTVADAMKFIADKIADFPKTEVVIKPPASACTDRVFYCTTEKEIENALAHIIGTPDVYGGSVTYAVVQERLIGEEYIVDTVSTSITLPSGELQTYHRLVGAWRYHRRPSTVEGMASIIDHVSWVPVEKLPEKMVEYSRNVLDGLSVKFGPAHLEIMATATGPVLIEVGARLPGGLPILAAEATGGKVHQIELAWESVLDPQKFIRDYEANGGAYPTGQAADILFLSVDQPGQYVSPEGLAQINKENFPTLNTYRLLGNPDGELALTTNVTNALLRAHFVGNVDDIERDKRKLNEMHGRRELFR